MDKEDELIAQFLKVFQQSRTACESAKSTIHHAINPLRQFWMDRYLKGYYISEGDIQIPEVDKQLLNNFYEATSQQSCFSPVYSQVINLIDLSRWCNQRGSPTLVALMALKRKELKEVLAAFYVDKKVSYLNKKIINKSISALRQLCPMERVEIKRNATFILPPEDRTFFDELQLKKQLTKNQVTALRCFSDWRRRQSLTGLREWIKAPEETAHQSLETFTKDEALVKKDIKKAFGNAVRRLRAVLAETQNQVPQAQIEEQNPEVEIPPQEHIEAQ